MAEYNADSTLVHIVVYPSGIDNDTTAEKLIDALCKREGISRGGIGFVMTTGYSRKILQATDDDISETTAHAYGVRITALKGYRSGIIVDWRAGQQDYLFGCQLQCEEFFHE